MEKQDYYKVLGLTPDASGEDIRTAYRRLAFEYHPDRNADNAGAADQMKVLNEAYAVLSDESKRRHYQTFYKQYGDGARDQFRRTFSEQDIFRGSDIRQMFEEMARACGLRGFDDIFKDLNGQGHQPFEFRSQGMFGRETFFGTLPGRGNAGHPSKGLGGTLARKLINKMVGALLPKHGGDLHDVIVLTPNFAKKGGPYAYHHRARDKKIVVHIPVGVRHEQLIRLSGMGQGGIRGGQAGDMLLKVKIREPILKKIKKMIGMAYKNNA